MMILWLLLSLSLYPKLKTSFFKADIDYIDNKFVFIVKLYNLRKLFEHKHICNYVCMYVCSI